MRAIAFLLFFCVAYLSSNAGINKHSSYEKKAIEEIRMVKDSINTVYEINNKVVSKEKFEKFNKSLKEISGTWYCAETTTGGITGYDAKDKKGRIYELIYCSESGKSTNSIILKTNVK